MSFKENISQILFVFAIIQVLLSSTCDAVSNDTSDIPATNEALKPLGARLYFNLVGDNSDKNIVFSPLSIEMCLAMLRMGAVGGTGQELDIALASSVKGPEQMANDYHDMLERYNKNKILRVANRIYVMKGFKARRPFYNSLTQKFLASMVSVNFNKNVESAKSINFWVKNQTTITDLISADKLSGDTRLVMVNAIHFKGQWASKFDPSQTSDEPFTLEDGTKFNVSMMFQKGKFNMAFMRDIGANILEMPYKDSNFSMIIVLPRYKQRLSDVEKNLNNIPWEKVEHQLRLEPEEYEVLIPKFKLEFKTDLTKSLFQVGLKRISTNAQFDKMLLQDGTPVKGLSVDAIVHKAFIEVDEEGASAGAASAVEMSNRIGPTQFRANKPFYFFIMDTINKKKMFEGRLNTKFSS